MYKNLLITTSFCCCIILLSCSSQLEDSAKPTLSPVIDSALTRKIKENNKFTEDSSLRQLNQPTPNKYVDCVFFKESRVKYDSDFKPSLFVTIQNNMDQDIVALEILLEPKTFSQDDCPSIIVKKKIVVPAKKYVTFQQEIKNENGCIKQNHPVIKLGDFILKDGTRTSVEAEKIHQILSNQNKP